MKVPMGDERSAWKARDSAAVWHGFTQMANYADLEPIIVERGDGGELIGVDGKRYLDAISSLWVTTLGHCVPELDQALIDQANKIAHSTLLGNSNRIVIEFAEALCAAIPVDDAHVLFASDGASAVEQALKIAYQYWINIGVVGKDSFVALGSAYHGDTIGALSVGDNRFGTSIFSPLCFDVLRTPGYDTPHWENAAIAMISEHRERLAAVIIEPLVQAASGIIVADPSAVEQLGRSCKENEVLLIADEVATGFGRTGTLFASEACGIRPDLMCLGKGITGGYLPMSATIAAEPIYRAFYGDPKLTFAHGHSYGGNALGAAVGLAHLQMLQQPQILKNVLDRAEQLRLLLDDRVMNHDLVNGVRQAGLLVGIELVGPTGFRYSDDGVTLGQLVCAAAVRRGVLLRPLGNVLPLVPPLTITDQEIVRLVDVLVASLEEIQDS